MDRLHRKNISLLTAGEIELYLRTGEPTAEEIAQLCADGRKSVQEIVRRFLQHRKKLQQEEDCLHNMSGMERTLQEQGYAPVAGVDEAGRGPLAGPVVAAAVILGAKSEPFWRKIRDSKQLSPQKREELFEALMSGGSSISVGVVQAETVDRINIHNASLEAMRIAVQKLQPEPVFVLSDGYSIPGLVIPQRAVKKGDSCCISIAAASIIAKVTRDRLMRDYEDLYPGYGFAQNKGYPTAEHREALKMMGPAPIHRRSFKLI